MVVTRYGAVVGFLTTPHTLVFLVGVHIYPKLSTGIRYVVNGWGNAMTMMTSEWVEEQVRSSLCCSLWEIR